MKAIPLVNAPEVYTPLAPTGSPFVELCDGEEFDVKMQYVRLGMEHAVPSCYVRKEVFHRLQQAQAALPDGLKLRIWDTWRPFALQLELYNTYRQTIITKNRLDKLSLEEQAAEIQKFVSYPTEDRNIPPVHTTGGAVDVTLVDACGHELPMGTPFDAFGPETATAYFESTSQDAPTVRDNRRILYHCMTGAGFTNLPSEWWHFDYGNRFWAYYTGNPAIYEGIFTQMEVQKI